MRLYMKLAIQGGRDEQGKYKLDLDLGILSLERSISWTPPKFASGVFAPENTYENEYNDEDIDMEISLAKFASGTTAAPRRHPPTSGFGHLTMKVIQKVFKATKLSTAIVAFKPQQLHVL